MLKNRAFVAFTILFVACSAGAATFVVPTDEHLVRSSEAIVRGVVISANSDEDANGAIRTVTEVAIFESIKGPIVSGEMLTLRTPGGRTLQRTLFYPGFPRFDAGEEVLLFLVMHLGRWVTKDLVLGKFTALEGLDGEPVYVRQREDICGWSIDGAPHQERDRRVVEFLEFVRDIANDRTDLRRDYLLPVGSDCALTSSSLTASPEAASDYVYCGCRWRFELTADLRTYRPRGTVGGSVDSDAAVLAGVDAWNNDSASNVDYSIGASNPNVSCGVCEDAQGFIHSDGTSTIILNDEFDEIEGSFSCPEGGVIGVAGPTGLQGPQHSFDGGMFFRAIEGDVVIQNGAECVGQALVESAIAHELGHTLGFRHSDAGSPSAIFALMAPSLNNGPGDASLLQWDTDAVRAVYGSGAPACAASISQHPQSQSVPSGSSANLSVTVGTGTYSYQWYRGVKGNTSDPVSGATTSSLNTGALTQTTSFWVRVTRTDCDPDSVLDSNAATVTVVPCTASITQHPQSQSVPVGDAANLSVSVGSGTYSYQWYRGESPDESDLLAGENLPTLSTGAITSTTSFWVKVTRTDCEPDSVANSNTATVTTCEVPAIVDEPQDATVVSGSGTTLSVTASGTSVFYQWYRGNSGVTSSPVIGGTNPTLATGNLTQTTKYWVRVANNCGGTKTVNSRTVTVTVTAQCTAPQISVQPQPVTIATGASTTLTVTATGSSLVYQWFEGASGVTTKPVGTNSPSYTTAALTATTSFWVRVSNSCGQLPSVAATVTVTAACTAPAIQQQPLPTTIAPGKTATLTVTATGTSLVYQWYEGLSGNTTRPVGTNSASFTTPALKKNVSYWVRLSNSCGQLASQTATVTVKSTRRHPIRR